MNRRSARWRALFGRRSGKIFLLAWVFATLTLTAAVCVMTFGGISSAGVEADLFGIIFILALFFYAVPAFFIGLCVVLVTAFSEDIRKSENTILTIVSVVCGIGLGIPSSGNLIVIAIGAVIGFISAVVALIMTKDLRLAFHADELSQ